jgi:GH15 family glucan-1,4-alpha-glucosidase
MPLPIQDYALIGDCHTAALVGRDGSTDWLCLPRCDSGACFAALLGSPDQGRWLLAPAAEMHAVRRRYREGRLILETEFDTDDGALRVIDCMPLSSGRIAFVFNYRPSHKTLQPSIDPKQALQQTQDDWLAWSQRCRPTTVGPACAARLRPR